MKIPRSHSHWLIEKVLEEVERLLPAAGLNKADVGDFCFVALEVAKGNQSHAYVIELYDPMLPKEEQRVFLKAIDAMPYEEASTGVIVQYWTEGNTGGWLKPTCIDGHVRSQHHRFEMPIQAALFIATEITAFIRRARAYGNK